jgi:hypothetical protein
VKRIGDTFRPKASISKKNKTRKHNLLIKNVMNKNGNKKKT